MKRIFFSILFLIVSNFAFAQAKENLTVNFDFNRSELTPQTMSKLDDFANRIGQQEIISMFMGGHCDSKGSNAYNDALSLRRVNAVKNYLSNKKINMSLLTSKGFGENNLLNTDSTEEESHQNRRVEIIAVIKTAPVAEVKKETRTLTDILEDTTVKKGAVISIPNLEFYNSSDALLPKSEPTLQELYNVLTNNPKMKISIEGHICCVPFVTTLAIEQQQNYNISVIRAKKVYDFLISKEIAAGRISYTAFGNSRPIYPIPEKTEEERVANRRVEIRIIDK